MKNFLKKSDLSISSELGIYSNLYKDIYFDKKNGIKETQHNFIRANNLVSRFKKSEKFIISELGFGTGLSFLMTLKLWKETKKPNAKLIYISFESAPLTKIELNNVYKKVSGVKILFNQLIKNILTSKHISFTNMICFTNNSICFHHVNYSCCSIVPNLKFSL